jgi:type IV pilus assembly protein PilW
MSPARYRRLRNQRGVGLVEVMIGIVIAMLLVLVIYQIYEVSEGQKRTITAGSDAQQNASYGLYVLSRDISMAGNGIASAAVSLDGCAFLRPIPVLIAAGATANDPDTITVLYGGSSSLATPVAFQGPHTVGDSTYLVRAPVGFSQNDLIVAVQGNNCTLSTIDNAAGAVTVDGNGIATITHTLVAGQVDHPYSAAAAALVNLGRKEAIGRIAYTVDTTSHALRTQRELPAVELPAPFVSDVVNLKAQYGLDTNNDGVVDTWQDASGPVWSAANLPAQPLATLRQIRAVRVAIVTRSAQYEKDPVTAHARDNVEDGSVDLTIFDGARTVSIQGADAQHYRYKVLETIVPLRNALWNAS